MATSFFVPGPVQLAFAPYTFPANGSAYFLGTCQGGVTVSHEAMFRPVRADYAADMPADYLWMGEVVTVTFRLVHFVPTNMQRFKARWLRTSAAGTIGPNELGTLLFQERSASQGTFQFWARYPNALAGSGHTGYIGVNETGLRLPSCVATGRMAATSSTQEQGWDCSVGSMTYIDPTTLGGVVWDTDMTNFPSPE